MKYPKRSQYKHCKKPYRVRNWPAYDAALQSRGDLTVWFSEDSIAGWHATNRRKRGGQLKYTNLAIETGLTVRMVYKLGLRQTEGFLNSLALLFNLPIEIPDHTTLSRRAKKLGKIRFVGPAANKSIHIMIDSTGLKVRVGNGHKPPKRRNWRKLHLAINPRTGGITAWDLTGKNAGDSGRVPTLLKQIDSPLTSVSADGAYDTEGVYKAILAKKNGEQTKIIIPPKRHAQLSSHPVLKQRNGHIRSIERLGRRKWEKKSRYSKRSLVENAMYRYKTIIGSQMRARSLAGQRVEASLGCKILNVMAGLGMPDSYRVE